MLYNNDETVEIVCEEFLASSLPLGDEMQYEDTIVFVHWDKLVIGC